ncbi:DUF6932 family protein [Vibrio campbellii]|uniref:DUF6932 family protein n=1 Tax=Vibrio campbellii TaxID=680 RepID=UPI003857BFED
MIPEFTERGLLPTGIHSCHGQEFIDRFCQNKRKDYTKTVSDIFDFARDRNARYVFVGGSFVSDSTDPSDIDVVIVLREQSHIPSKGERLLIGGKKTDIMFCSEDDPKLVDAFIALFSRGRFGQEVGVVQVDLLYSNEVWSIKHMPSDYEVEIVKRVYSQREIIDLDETEGVLVTIHGLLSTGAWNGELLPVFSDAGWTVAPYYYGVQSPDILVREKQRKEAVDKFREWIHGIYELYCKGTNRKISVIAHSFGTYLIGAYLNGFEGNPPVEFESIILTGSILNEDYDWGFLENSYAVGNVRNEIAPNDQWVKWMPKSDWIKKDPLFGQAGVNGFNTISTYIEQNSCTIFDHNNVIKRDVALKYWLPYLKASRGCAEYKGFKKVFDSIKTA